MKSLARFALPLGVLLLSSVALGAVKHEGTWPEADKPITLDVSGLSKAEAVRRIADAAGWNVVIHAPPGDPIDIHVKNQPPGKVLDLVLHDGAYTARREGDLIEIDRDTATSAAPAAPAPPEAPQASPLPPVPAVPPVPPVPPAPPLVTARGEDRVVTGGNLRVEKGETVNDVTVFGGAVDVYGTVTGNLVVTGGSAHIHSGGVVEGDATAVGGALDVEDGAEVEGDVGVIGGVLNRAAGSKIGGKVVSGGRDENVRVRLHHDGLHVEGVPGESRSALHSWTAGAGGALTRISMLFVFGAVLLALGSRRMEALREEVALRPMRSFALGVVGVVAGIVAIVLLCITVVGIPVAVVAVLVAVFGVYAGICAVLTTLGEALTRHKTKNPYAHLAVGCALFLVLGAIPYLGGLLTAAVGLIGVGVLVATRGAGLVRPRTPGQGPYRSAPAM